MSGFMLALALMLPAYAADAANEDGDIVCFVYHRFGDDRYPSTNIDLDVFRGQLAYLKQNNFTVWPMGRAVEAIQTGTPIPPKTIVLTIDDGYHSFYTNGLPLLEEYGFPATLYVNTESVGHKDYMSWQEILEAEKRGVEIGNHSHGHLHFLDVELPKERISIFVSDLVSAQTIFEKELGFIPKLYSYPYGEYDAIVSGVLTDAGYLSATAQYSGVMHKEHDLMTVPRFPMGGPYATLKGFIQKSQMHAMPLISKNPPGIVMQTNPPQMEIIFGKECIDADNIQCFVDGDRNCIMEIQEGPTAVKIKIISRDKLEGRRSLYTITAPSKDGAGWCWYSHVWVNTDVKEE